MDSIIGGLNSAYTNNSVGTTSSALQDKLNNSDLSKATDDELMEVCKDFEAYFVEQMMKAMVKMSKIDGDTDDDNMYSSLFGLSEDSGSYMNTMANYFGGNMVTELSKTVTEAQGGQGLGIAKMLYEQMKRNYSIPEAQDEEAAAQQKDAVEAL